MIFIVSQSQRLNFQNTMMHQEKEGGNKAKQQPESQRIEMTKRVVTHKIKYKFIGNQEKTENIQEEHVLLMNKTKHIYNS